MGQPESKDGQRGNSRLRSAAEVSTLVSIPEHELLRRIGSGSYGEVWLARSTMGAYRAVKIVFRDSFASARPFERELVGIHKFEPISRSHEGFIDVLQVGINEERGYFYYVMEAADDEVKGRDVDPTVYTPNTLGSEITRRGRLSLQECLQLGLALTHALAELHKHDLVHRDIKPSNVIFADGVPKLADIGLVAGVGDTRSFVGTEGFIPPEGPGKPEADLFSLGMVLYEASTGNDRHQYPELPSEWGQSPEYGGLLELNEIILKACDAEAKNRYHSAWDMHADLVVVVNGKSVKRLRLLERRMAQFRKGAGVGALVIVIAGLLLFQLFREWRIAAEENQRQVTANVTYGNRAMEAGDLFGALPYFAEAFKLDERKSKTEMTHRLRLGSTLAECPKLVQMWFEPMEVSDAEFSPDDKSVLLSQYYGKAEIHDLESGALRYHAFGPPYCLRSASYSPDGRYIVTASESHVATVWDSVSVMQFFELSHPNKVYVARFSPDGKRIVTACKDGVARVWDAKTGRLAFVLPPHADLVSFASFSHNGRLLVTASHDGTARVWYADNGRPATEPLRHPRWVNWAGFSPDDDKLVTACEDHKVRVWEVAIGKEIMPRMSHNDAVETAEFSHDGRFILTASFDGTVRLWNTSDHQPAGPVSILRHGERVVHASFSSDGRQIASSCVDGSVRVWDLAGAMMPPKATRRSFCHDGNRFIASLSNSFQICEARDGTAVSPRFSSNSGLERAIPSSSGDFVLTISLRTSLTQTNHVLKVWSAGTGKFLGPAISVPPPFTGATLSDSGERVAVYGSNMARIWSAKTGTALSPPLFHREPVARVVFSPSADLLVTLSGANAEIWNAHTGQPRFPPFELPTAVADAEFSRDGRFLVTCCSDPMLTKCSAQVWDVGTGRTVGGPLRHDDGVLSASFSPDGRRVVTASEDFTAKVWEVETGRQIGLPLRHKAQVQAAVFSPGGEWVATASIDQTARVWDAWSGDPITPPLKHLVNLWDIKFVGDGHHLAVADRRGDTFEWSLAIDDRKAKDVNELTDFLFGGDFISPVNPSKQATDPVPSVWRRLRAKYPGEFTVSKEEVMRWHEFQAEESESEEEWAAAAFHLELLQTLCPGDSVLSQHLARVKEHLQKQ